MRQFYSSHDEVLFKHTNASPSENEQQHATNAQAQKCVYLYGHNAHRRKLTPPLQKSTIMSPGWATSRTAVTKFSSCWHLRSTRLAGTSPVDTKTEMLVSPSFPAVDICAPHTWLVPCLLTQKQMLLSPSFPAVDTCVPHTWLVPCLLTQKQMLLSPSFPAVDTCAPHALLVPCLLIQKQRCCCHQVFQLLTLVLHMLGWYLACWHKNRDAAVIKFFSCWHLCSTRLVLKQ